jgi:hypothetical protein
MDPDTNTQSYRNKWVCLGALSDYLDSTWQRMQGKLQRHVSNLNFNNKFQCFLFVFHVSNLNFNITSFDVSFLFCLIYFFLLGSG